jgi:phosphoglycerol transferase MdoB-like AlkP superfamily enzyme
VKDFPPTVRTLLWAAVFLLSLGSFQYLYCELSRAWVPYGGTSVELLRLEFPLFVALAFVFFVPPRKKGWRSLPAFLLAFLPLFLLYALLDAFYLGLHRSARFSDFPNLGTLIRMSPLQGWGIVALLGLALLGPLFRWFLGLRRRTPKERWHLLLPRGLVFLGLVGFVGSGFLWTYMQKSLPLVVWSDTRNLQLGGRFTSLFFYSYRRAATLEKLKALGSREGAASRFEGSIQAKRNLHLFVMESFLDPRLVRGIQIRGKALAPALARILQEEGGEDLDRVKTPIYGGSTPQTEFEVLTGLPALALAGSVEFNLMEGAPIASLCAALKAQGYRCVATIATPPQFFNSVLAYKSLGFDVVHFLDGKSYLQQIPGDPWMFDGDLLAQNLAYIESHFLTKGQPVFNYLLGSFGHLPFQRNLKKRPDLCSLEEASPKSPKLLRILNQFRYRTEALANFLKAIRTKDPQSLFYLSSDHLPPIFGRGLVYSLDDKVNVSLFFDRGRRVPLPLLRSYTIPYHLWGRLTQSPPHIPNQKALEAGYLQALAQGMGLSSEAKEGR